MSEEFNGTSPGQEDPGVSGEARQADAEGAGISRDSLIRRLREAAGRVPRGEEWARAEKSELRLFFEESPVAASLPKRFPDGAGSEHEVWIVDGNALKATMPGEAGRIWSSRRMARPSEYLERMAIANDEFRMPWELVGIAEECR